MAGGISKALITTVLGLLAAIPSLLLVTMLTSKIRIITEQLDSFALSLIEKYEDQLQDLGLNLRHFGGNSWLLDSTPLNFPENRLIELIKEIVDILHNSPDSLKKDLHIHLAKIISRVAANRAQFNERSSEKILKELDKCETPYSCPQGKPVFINISHSELKKRFGRS